MRLGILTYEEGYIYICLGSSLVLKCELKALLFVRQILYLHHKLLGIFLRWILETNNYPLVSCSVFHRESEVSFLSSSAIAFIALWRNTRTWLSALRKIKSIFLLSIYLFVSKSKVILRSTGGVQLIHETMHKENDKKNPLELISLTLPGHFWSKLLSISLTDLVFMY